MLEDSEINRLTGIVIGCAMRIHRTLGNGFPEVIYQRCLAIELNIAGLSFEREKEMIIYYRGENVGTRRVDFLINDKIMVELKAVADIEPAHLNQILNYCEAYNIPDGLLLNFGSPKLGYKRIINKKFGLYTPNL